MGIGNFYKQPKPSKFRYVYRYYDPKKEEDEKRRRRIRRELGITDEVNAEDIKEEIKGSFRRQSEVLQKYGEEGVRKESFAELNRTPIILLILGAVMLLALLRNSDSGLMRYILQGFQQLGSLLGING